MTGGRGADLRIRGAEDVSQVQRPGAWSGTDEDAGAARPTKTTSATPTMSQWHRALLMEAAFGKVENGPPPLPTAVQSG